MSAGCACLCWHGAPPVPRWPHGELRDRSAASDGSSWFPSGCWAGCCRTASQRARSHSHALSSGQSSSTGCVPITVVLRGDRSSPSRSGAPSFGPCRRRCVPVPRVPGTWVPTPYPVPAWRVCQYYFSRDSPTHEEYPRGGSMDRTVWQWQWHGAGRRPE